MRRTVVTPVLTLLGLHLVACSPSPDLVENRLQSAAVEAGFSEELSFQGSTYKGTNLLIEISPQDLSVERLRELEQFADAQAERAREMGVNDTRFELRAEVDGTSLRTSSGKPNLVMVAAAQPLYGQAEAIRFSMGGGMAQVRLSECVESACVREVSELVPGLAEVATTQYETRVAGPDAVEENALLALDLGTDGPSLRTNSVAADPITAERLHELIGKAATVMDVASPYRLSSITTGPVLSSVRLAGETPDLGARARVLDLLCGEVETLEIRDPVSGIEEIDLATAPECTAT